MKTGCVFNPFCLSSFLTFRYVVNPSAEWVPGVRPPCPTVEPERRAEIHDSGQLLDALCGLVDPMARDHRVGILLSGGIDSAILAALLPRGTPAYTVRFEAEGAVDESRAAAVYARRCRLLHHIVTVSWEDYQQHMDGLMRRKCAPLHPVETGLYLAARAAANDGVNFLMVGNGADSTFGGLDRLLSKDWTLQEFIKRYTFVDPSTVLRDPVSMHASFAGYERAGGFDTVAFLKEVHGRGIIQAFDNAIHAAGCNSIAPYESLALGAPLDLERVRRGEPKYLLREVFTQLYPGLSVADKVAFARPMDGWMNAWTGPHREEFKPDLDLRRFSGEQKWLLYCLERFLDLMEDT